MKINYYVNIMILYMLYYLYALLNDLVYFYTNALLVKIRNRSIKNGVIERFDKDITFVVI